MVLPYLNLNFTSVHPSKFCCNEPPQLSTQNRITEIFLNICEGESEVLQYFANMMHNSAALDTFAKDMNLTKHTGLWDAELTWYSPSAAY